MNSKAPREARTDPNEGPREDQGEKPEPEQQRPKSGQTMLTPEQQKKAKELLALGTLSKRQIAGELQVPYDRIKRFLKDEEPGEGQAVKGDAVERTATAVAVGKFLQVTKGAAIEVANEMATIGTFVWENYREDARLLGLEVTEYLVRAITFYKSQREHVEELLQENRHLVDLVERQRKMLSPVPYRMAALLEMIRRGDDFDLDEIDAFVGVAGSNGGS
jgi:hypothetical protein